MGDPTTAWQLLPNGTNSARYNDSAGAAIPLGADLGLPSAIFKIPSSGHKPSLLRPSSGESGIARGVGRGEAPRGARRGQGRGGSALPVDSPARRWAVLRAHGAGRGRVSWVAAVGAETAMGAVKSCEWRVSDPE